MISSAILNIMMIIASKAVFETMLRMNILIYILSRRQQLKKQLLSMRKNFWKTGLP